ncbi:hypothetical protein KAX08_02985 [candidate division WOR-3 bacterium]|nr:hypothetical protein [candidate division WOR-3 bacterium]
MDDEILNELKKQTKLLKEHTNWLKFLALPKLKEIIIKTFESKAEKMEKRIMKKRIYELSNGQNSSPQIAQKLTDEGIKVTDRTVRNYWDIWYTLGIVTPSEEYKGRYKKFINFGDLDLEE